MDPVCWICKDDYSIEKNYCNCKNEYKVVHDECMKKWIQYSRERSCKLCNKEYNIISVRKPFSQWVFSIKDCKKSAILYATLFLCTFIISLVLTRINITKIIDTSKNDVSFKLVTMVFYLLPFVITCISFITLIVYLYKYCKISAKNNTYDTIYEL
ncbi:SPV009 LAP/PHD-finger-like protein [Swinepox virus]|uniref:E3 ubiquitin-protein ligase LAP n=1 Tax=Swinepox virus (strain Swine/Nebraska/17077-99/1999) TaxID=300880 RepID=Q8V3S5_SWPV1|nr:LAP/PHD finger-like protein [Swinepox virus]AAL69748.1 SPV009 LAP/PHD-finger-like protein [Swinepox virus]UUA44199.1 SPV009 [Swinepox virus]